MSRGGGASRSGRWSSRGRCESDPSIGFPYDRGEHHDVRRARPRLAPEGTAFVAQLRADAFERFSAMPVPSQETEEWRYTDLSAFELDFQPFADGGGPEDVNRHGILASAGVAGERAGLQIQRNSTVLSTQRSATLTDRGVWFGSLDEASETHPELVEPFLHQLVPAGRTRFTALHAAFRTGGTFLHVPPDTALELPIQTFTYLDADGAAVFPHTLIVVEAGSEVTFIDRYASPDLARAFSDAITEIHVGAGAHVRYVSIQEWGSGVTHLGIQRATVGRDATLRTLNIGFGASLARAEAETILAEPGGFSEMLGIFFADEEQHFDHRSIQDHVAPNCTSDLLYKGALRDHSRAIYSGWVHVRPDAQKTNAMQTYAQHRPVRAREGRRDPEPRDRGERRAMRPRGERRPGGRGRDLLPDQPRDPSRGGGAAHRLGVLPGGARPREDRRGPRRRRAGDPGRARPSGHRPGRPQLMGRVRVCEIADAPAPGEAKRFPVDGRLVALVNLGDEGLRAIDAICSHAHYFLDEGDVDTDFETIECPKHGSSFDLNSGKPRSLPATTPVDVFPITTEDDDIYIEV